jgi:hypothetical protein
MPHALLTRQYIKYFGEEMTTRGEEGYWWTQFFSAVRFLQSIDDRSDLASPKRASLASTRETTPSTSAVRLDAMDDDEVEVPESMA